MHRSQLSLYWLEQIRRKTARFVHLDSDIRDDPGTGHNLLGLFAAGRPHVQPIFQIKQSPQGVRQKTPAPISNFLLRRRSVLAHPNCHFRVVCAGCDEFPQCFRIQSTGSKEFAVHRAVVMIRAAPTGQFRPAFIHQTRSHSRKAAERSPRASGSVSVQIERKRTELFRVHNSA
jgi:hypothetical protein